MLVDCLLVDFEIVRIMDGNVCRSIFMLFFYYVFNVVLNFFKYIFEQCMTCSMQDLKYVWKFIVYLFDYFKIFKIYLLKCILKYLTDEYCRIFSKYSLPVL